MGALLSSPKITPTPQAAAADPAARRNALVEERRNRRSGVAGNVRTRTGDRALSANDFARAFTMGGSATRTGPGGGAV